MHFMKRPCMYYPDLWCSIKLRTRSRRKSRLTFAHQWSFPAQQWHSFASVGIRSALKCIPAFLYVTPKITSRAESSGRREHNTAVSCFQAPVPTEPALTDSFCCMIGNKFFFVKQNSTDCIKV